MADIPATHYVKSDDVHIAYQVIGDGPRDLLFVPGFVSNVEALWQSPARASFFRRLATFARVIMFDKRGTGMSDRGSQIFTLEQRMHDVQAVLDQVGSQRATLFGVSEAYALHPLPDSQERLDDVYYYGYRGWDQGRGKSPEKFPVQRDSESLVIETREPVDVLPVLNRFIEGIILIIRNVVTDRPSLK